MKESKEQNRNCVKAHECISNVLGKDAENGGISSLEVSHANYRFYASHDCNQSKNYQLDTDFVVLPIGYMKNNGPVGFKTHFFPDHNTVVCNL